MLVNIRHYKLNTTDIPTYLDGYFDVYEVRDDGGTYPVTKLFHVVNKVPFERLSIGDRLRIESDQQNINLTYKLRVDEHAPLTTKHYLRIDSVFHKIFNVFQFTNKSGYRQTDITLEEVKKEIKIHDDKD